MERSVARKSEEPGQTGPRNRYYRGPPSDHFDGRLFFNPGGTDPSGIGPVLEWQFGGHRARWPKQFPSPFPLAVPAASVDGLRITMVGHASLLIQTGGLNILIDPVWSDRCSPFSFAGPRRVWPPGIRFEDLPPIHAVLVSHNHYDHLDLPTLKRLAKAHDPLVVTPLGNDTIIKGGAPTLKVRTADWWGRVALKGGVSIHLVPAHHWSARWIKDRRMALWCGFVIESAAGALYAAGDTGFGGGRHYRQIRARFPDIRFAILPIGAYEPRWFMAPQHQDPAEAVQAMQILGAPFAGGMHWGTWQLTNEAVDAPRDELLAALDKAGIARETFLPLYPGQVWDVPEA